MISWDNRHIRSRAVQSGAGHGKSSGFGPGHSHQTLSRGHVAFYLQPAVDVGWLLPHSNMVMHLHSQHKPVFVLKD